MILFSSFGMVVLVVPLAPVAKHLTVAGAKDISIEEAILVVFCLLLCIMAVTGYQL